MCGRSFGRRRTPAEADFDVEPLQHQTREPPKPARRYAAAKVALAGVAGLALAFFWVQQPLTAPLPDTAANSRHDLGRGPQRHFARLYHGDRAERRHRAERPAHGARQARLHRGLVRRGNRQGAGPDPGGAGDRLCAGGRLRPADRTPALPRHHGRARRRLCQDARRHRPQSQGRRLQDHLFHRRPRRQPEAPGRGGPAPDARMGAAGRPGDRRIRLLRRRGRDRISQEPGRDAGIDRPACGHRRHLGTDGGASRRRRNQALCRRPLHDGADRRLRRSDEGQVERGRALLNIKIFAAIRQIKALAGGI